MLTVLEPYRRAMSNDISGSKKKHEAGLLYIPPPFRISLPYRGLSDMRGTDEAGRTSAVARSGGEFDFSLEKTEDDFQVSRCDSNHASYNEHHKAHIRWLAAPDEKKQARLSRGRQARSVFKMVASWTEYRASTRTYDSVTITDLQIPPLPSTSLIRPVPQCTTPSSLAIQILPAHQPHTMALNTTGSPSSGGDSHSPSPVLSDNPQGDSSEHRSSRSTPTRAMSDLTRSLSAGKGGCWTCRVRRKVRTPHRTARAMRMLTCDAPAEVRRGARGDSCKTCLRLKINCLGWGPSGPSGCECDKEKVAAYKASIKEQLSRAGLIRGNLAKPGTPPPPHPIASSSTSAPPPSQAGPRTLRRSSSSAHRHGYGVPAPYTSRHDGPHIRLTTMTLLFLPQATSARAPPPRLFLRTLRAPHHDRVPADAVSVPPPTPTSPPSSPRPWTTRSSGRSSREHPRRAVARDAEQPTQEDYVLYYFEHVRRLQYVFAGDSLASTLYTIVLAEPDGAVATAICALASLYSTRMRIAQGLESPQPDPEQSPPNASTTRPSTSSSTRRTTAAVQEHDAVAAVQLISYGLLNGGGTDWATVLEIACDWLAQTGIHAEENPSSRC
ncbi:hypothetical protein A0H81_07618 [Grifola frondosa]|uniref:Uncharacterized protein n=1 Tax=Grifola frondosa TaxID=5627 RepID=A0A1C7M5I2_GRIFR|nr:hypothetical protein A0H81_07618 [Grifola frondosa]